MVGPQRQIIVARLPRGMSCSPPSREEREKDGAPMFTSLVFCWLGNGRRLGQFWHFRSRGRGRYRRSLTDFNGAVLVIQHHVSAAAIYASAGGRAIVSVTDFEFAEIGLDFSVARLG